MHVMLAGSVDFFDGVRKNPTPSARSVLKVWSRCGAESIYKLLSSARVCLRRTQVHLQVSSGVFLDKSRLSRERIHFQVDAMTKRAMEESTFLDSSSNDDDYARKRQKPNISSEDGETLYDHIHPADRMSSNDVDKNDTVNDFISALENLPAMTSVPPLPPGVPPPPLPVHLRNTTQGTLIMNGGIHDPFEPKDRGSDLEKDTSSIGKGFSSNEEGTEPPKTTLTPADYVSSNTSGKKPRIKANNSKFQCDTCDRTFASRQGLQNHILTVHLKKRIFECKQCSKKFSANGSLKRHVDTVHKRKREFQCQRCLKMFALKHHLKNHMITVHHDRNVDLSNVKPIRRGSAASIGSAPAPVPFHGERRGSNYSVTSLGGGLSSAFTATFLPTGPPLPPNGSQALILDGGYTPTGSGDDSSGYDAPLDFKSMPPYQTQRFGSPRFKGSDDVFNFRDGTSSRRSSHAEGVLVVPFSKDLKGTNLSKNKLKDSQPENLKPSPSPSPSVGDIPPPSATK